MTTENTDTLADVAGSHTVTEAERAALAEPEAQADQPVIPTAAPAAAADAAATAAAATDTDADAATKAAADEAAVAKAVVDAAALATATAAEVAAAKERYEAPPAPAGPVLLPVPEAPKDFDAEIAALDKQLEDGDIDDVQYAKQSRALTLEQAKFESSKSAIEAHNDALVKTHTANAAAEFESVVSRWTKENEAFMANPLRRKAMQDAVNVIDTETGGKLGSAELIDRAAKVAFEAFGWSPAPADPAAAQQAAQEAARKAAAALQGRQPPTDQVPRTLGDAPSAGSDIQTGKFGHLDGASALDMEAAIARMTPAEQDAFLREVDAPIY